MNLTHRLSIRVALVALLSLGSALAWAQTPPVPAPQAAATPQPAQPPTDIGPVVFGIELRIVPDNVFTVVPSETYLYYIRSRARTATNGFIPTTTSSSSSCSPTLIG